MVRIPTHRKPTHPGEMLEEEFLKPMQITGQQLAEAIHVPLQKIEDLIQQNDSVNSSLALRLARFFGMSADFWLNLQIRWDLYQTQQFEKAELDSIQDFHHFKKSA
ncbi:MULTISPECIES: HigA family addiction module antitoxin [Methylomonas]|uniref:Transcriptional regulator n=1 Tax=Methylomonas koyamae TaxID=702114 RepID=A0A177N6T1_9GAMM|nr:HigA family addiction module antitoxin [Methylomonas koyamae]OAI13561.1 transcriptional regulator [Methylomonas koyamae]